MTMKLLGSADDSGGRGQTRSQDDAAVGYVFQRHAHDPEFSQFAQKQHRWASGDDTIMDNQDKWKYNGLMNSGGGGGLLNQSSKMSHSPQVQQMMNHHQQLQQQQQQQQMHMHNQQSHHMAPQQHMQQQQQHPHLHPMGTNASGLSSNNLGMSHLAPGQQQTSSQQQQQQAMSNYSMNNMTATGQPLQMAIQGGLYDHQQHQGMNGMTGQMPNPLTGGTPKVNEHMVYLGAAQPHLNVIPPQNQYMTTPMSRGIASNAAKKLWEKGGPGDMKLPSVNNGPLPPLQLPGGPDNQVWRDSTWSTQGELMTPRRSFPIDTNSGGILSPRDSTGGLGVKIVEYVLNGSPTNKDSPLAGLEPRLRGLKFEDSEKTLDDKEKAYSHFETNGISKKDEQGIEEQGFNRTPGSRQSPAEEGIPGVLLDPSCAYPQHPMNYHMPMLNDGMAPVQPQDHFFGQQQQQQQQQQQSLPGSHMESAAPGSNLLQHNFDVQQLFRSTANATTPGQPNGTPLPQHMPPFMAQNAYAAAAAAAQQSQYVLNPGQEVAAAPYMGLFPGMHQYYGVGSWVYPGIIPQQGTQPRRPLTPSQGTDNAQYQVIPFYDQSGSLLMGPRTGTPMRLVSPAPVMVPPNASRGPPQAPQIYPPQQTQQSLYSTQNGSSVGVGGGGGLFAPQAFGGGLGSPAQPSGLALNTTSLSGRRDSFDRNTSAFSPSSIDYTSGNINGRSSTAKWPIGSYGAVASASPHGAPITPPPSGLGALITNRAPGAESKYRNLNQLAPSVSAASAHAAAAAAAATNAMFGSSSSIFSKLSGVAVRPNVAPTTANAAGVDRQTGRSRLLEDFRNQRYPNLQLRDLTNHIVEFSQDQHGSRFIQQKLERATTAEKQLVFNEILSAAYNLMTDVFGNYVIQKFFEYGTPEQKQTLAQQVRGHVLPLALQMYGCRVIQKALESIPSDQQQDIVLELDGHVLKCVKDQNGNHVVQKCIECIEPAALQFIINAFQGQVYTLSTHPYGCRVIQRILEHCTAEQTAPILAELHAHTNQLIEDQYGNYVIQHVLEHGKQEDKSKLIATVKGRVLVMSQHKFASNVVEKCVTHAARAERSHLIEEVCKLNDTALHLMMKDQYANYVVQKMIDVSEPTQRKTLMLQIRPHMNSLKKYTYGKHIIAKIEKFFSKSSNAAAVGPPATPLSNGASPGSVNSSPTSINGIGASDNNLLGPIGPPQNGI